MVVARPISIAELAYFSVIDICLTYWIVIVILCKISGMCFIFTFVSSVPLQFATRIQFCAGLGTDSTWYLLSTRDNSGKSHEAYLFEWYILPLFNVKTHVCPIEDQRVSDEETWFFWEKIGRFMGHENNIRSAKVEKIDSDGVHQRIDFIALR